MGDDGRRTVLVVDDNQALAEVVRRHLAAQALTVQVAHTAAEAEALFTARPPDAVVTDLLLPDHTGHRLLSRLSRRGTLPPVFVMTGVFRGAASRADVMGRAPIRGWFEKPFDVRLLTDAVCEALGSTARDDPGDSDEHLWDQSTLVDLGSGPSTAAPPAVVTPDGDPFRDAHSGFGRSTTPSASDMSVGLRTLLRSGDLRAVPAPRLIGAFFVARETGEVAFEGEGRRQIVYFEGGQPVYAVSNRREDRLERALADHLRLDLDHDRWRAALAGARADNRSVPDELVRRKMIDLAQVERVRRDLTRRLLLDLFAWPAGQYVIRFRQRPDLPRFAPRDDTGALVIDGVRGGFSLARLQQLLPDHVRPMPSPNPPVPLFSLPIHDAEARLLLKVTGARPVRALIAEAPPGLDERAVRAIVYGLLALGVLVAGRPVASGSKAGTGEVFAG